MARFVLKRCKIRNEKLVVIRTEDPLDLDWEGIKTLISCAPGDAKLLGSIRPGAFLGVISDRTTGKDKPFMIYNFNKSNNIEWLDSKDQTFKDRVKSVFVVEYVRWDGNVVESSQRPESDTGAS
jgi:hypothetical protein